MIKKEIKYPSFHLPKLSRQLGTSAKACLSGHYCRGRPAFLCTPGIDLRAILRALTRDFRSGDFSEGGSTITQQLAKNLFYLQIKLLGERLMKQVTP
jgi:hypothetical protein